MAGTGGVISNAVDIVGHCIPLYMDLVLTQMHVAGQVDLDVDR